MVTEAAGERLGEGGDLGAQPPLGQIGQYGWVALAIDERLERRLRHGHPRTPSHERDTDLPPSSNELPERLGVLESEVPVLDVIKPVHRHLVLGGGGNDRVDKSVKRKRCDPFPTGATACGRSTRSLP